MEIILASPAAGCGYRGYWHLASRLTSRLANHFTHQSFQKIAATAKASPSAQQTRNLVKTLNQK
jgi:hypothetical protein